MKRVVGLWVVLISACIPVFSQVDTSYIYNTAMPYGTLDLRIAKSATRYYYLQEDVTFSFRESSPGVKTNTFRDITSWDSKPYKEGNLREKSGNTDFFVMNYRVMFPINYKPDYKPGYPIIIMMHGLGERGNCWNSNCYWSTSAWNPNTNSPPAPTIPTHNLMNNDGNLMHGGVNHLNAVKLAGSKLPDDPTLNPRAFPGFVLFPQNLNGWGSARTVEDAIRIIRLLLKKYNIDENRVYIHGLSNGGGAVYQALKRAPWLFAAALPMSAINNGGIIVDGRVRETGKIPLWVFQGGKDMNPTPSNTYNTVKHLRDSGGVVRYSLYPNIGHGTWGTAYNEPEFFSWMLSKRKYNPHISFGNPVICNTTGVGAKLSFSKGYFAYQWELDGQIISGANKPEYMANSPGTYRGRFSRKLNPTDADWEPWSDPIVVTEVNPAKPDIEPLSSTHLRGPGLASTTENNTVKLRSAAKADLYQWFKNDVAINFPATDVEDTLRYASFTSGGTGGNGIYTLKAVYSYCPSPPSDPLNLFFANSAPQSITLNAAEVDFKGSIMQAGIFLTWNDVTSSELAYEIWRRKSGTTDFKFAGRTPKDAISFFDAPLEPTTTYEYKLRAVNNSGTSNYIPSNVLNVNYTIVTGEDFEAPTAPQELVVKENTINSVTLTWKAGTDNNAVKEYLIEYDNGKSVLTDTAATTFTLTGLSPNITFPVAVKTVDFAGHISPPSNQIIASTYVLGLFYRHSTGGWQSLDDTTMVETWKYPEFTGYVSNFTLAPRRQEDYFNFQFTGYLDITTAGNYAFKLTSNDGARLILDGVRIIDNDGLHGNVTKYSDTLFLTSGAHPIEVQFFEYVAGQVLTVQYAGPDPGPQFVTMPDSVFRSGKYIPPNPIAPPTNLTAQGAGMQKVNLTWQNSEPSEVEIYRSTSQNGTYAVIVKTSALSFSDTTGLTPGTTYYYKARNIKPSGASYFTAIVNATTSADTAVPTAPTGLVVDNNAYTQVTFKWNASTDNVGVTGYEVYSNGVLIDSTSITAYTADGLQPNTPYTFKLKAFDASGNKSEFSADLVIGTSIAGIYYSLATGNLNDLATWKQNANGTGNSPVSFSENGQYFLISNRTQTTLGGDWTVSGSGSKVVLPTGVTLTADYAFTAPLEIEGNAILNLNHTTVPVLQKISTASTINFNATQTIPKNIYGNVILSGTGIKVFESDTTQITGDLSVNDGITLKGASDNASFLMLGGNLTINGVPGITAADNRIDLQFTPTVNHTISTGGDIHFFRITSGGNSTITVNNTSSPISLRLGSLKGGGLVLGTGSVLNIKNNDLDLTHAATINPSNETGIISINEGTISIASSSSQNSNLYFDAVNNLLDTLNVEATGDGDIVVRSALQITDALRIVNGELNAGGNVTLLTGPTKTASILQIQNNGKISGNIKAQHYLTPLGESWRELSTPVSGVTVSNWQTYFPITGNFSGSSSGGSVPSMFISNGTGLTPYPPSGGTNQAPIERGRGYSVKLNNPSAITLQETGNPFQGNISFTLAGGSGGGGTTGWNLVGNPYASPIQWSDNNEAWIRSGVSRIIAVKENKVINGQPIGQYVYYDPLLGNGTIRAGQAFWIQAFTAAPVLTITEKAKAEMVSTYPTPDSTHYLKISLQQGEKVDNTFIIFSNVGTDAFDNLYDAPKKQNEGIFNLSSLTGTIDLAINNLSESFCSKTVKINIQNASPGSYSLSFEGLASLSGIGAVKLTDNFTGTVTAVSTTPYAFSITSDANSFGSQRFSLTVDRQGLDTATPVVTGNDVCGNDQGLITITKSQAGVEYVALNDQDKIISDTVQGGESSISLILSQAALNSGSNHIRVRAGFSGCSSQMLASSTTITYMPSFSITVSPEVSVCVGEQAMLQANGPSGSSYKWYDENDVLIDSVQEGQFVTPPMFEEAVYHVAAVQSNGCESEHETIHVYAESLEKPVIALNNDTLFTQVDAIYQWKKAGQVIEGATLPFYVPSTSGSYTLLASRGGCVKESDPFNFVSTQVCNFDTKGPKASANSNCGAAISIRLSNTQLDIQYTAINETGTAVSASIKGNGSNIDLPLISSLLKTGANHLRVKAGFEGCESKILESQVDVQHTPGFSVETKEELSVCKGSSCTMTASGAPENGRYQWFNASGNPIDVAIGSSYIIAEVKEDLVYYVSAVNASGCQSEKKRIHITAITVPTPVVTVQEDTLVTDAQGALQWKMYDTEISGATQSFYVPAQSGVYSVVVTIEGCPKESEPVAFMMHVTTAIGNIGSQEFVINTFPVPSTSNDFRISALSPSSEKIFIQLIDITGRPVFRKWYGPGELNNGVPVVPESGPLSDGVYIVIGRQGLSEVRRRVVIKN